jgi:hypothetical protein
MFCLYVLTDSLTCLLKVYLRVAILLERYMFDEIPKYILGEIFPLNFHFFVPNLFRLDFVVFEARLRYCKKKTTIPMLYFFEGRDLISSFSSEKEKK